MDIIQFIVAAIGYAITFGMSGLIVRFFAGVNETAQPAVKKPPYDLGAIIGKCENFLTVTLILVGAYTGLALIFTAKSIVRGDEMRKNPKYYLGGTLVNFSYSVFMGFFIRAALNVLGHGLSATPS